MRLDLYLARQDESATSFAKRAGVEPSTITRIMNGERSPSLEVAKKIVDASDGKVTFEDLIAA